MSKPCVFFDRDGIVNTSPGPGKYVERLEQFFLEPAFVDSLRVTARKGYDAVIVTNQRGVARGLMTMDTVNEIHDKLVADLAAHGLGLLDILVCADESDASPRRKPNPGMLFEAARKHGLDLADSWMIGDHPRDVEAGHRAGCRTVFVGSAPAPSAADFRVDDMNALAAFLEAHLGAARGV